MKTSTKLSIKWFLIGMGIYIAVGVITCLFGDKLDLKTMREPPPYAVAFLTLMGLIPAVVGNAMAAGARETTVK